MKRIIVILLLLSPYTNAQILDRLGRRVEQKVKQKADQKIDQAIDKTLNKAEDSLEGKKKSDNSTNETKRSESKRNESKDEASEVDEVKGEVIVTPVKERFSATSKFDFVPGDKIIAVEDFSQDEIGDFPDKWNTNASAEIMKLSNAEGKWLALTAKGALTPEFMGELPENATIEFDLVTTPNYNYYSSVFQVALAEITEPNDYLKLAIYGGNGALNGALFTLHPQDAGSDKLGRTEIKTFERGVSIISNDQGKISAFTHLNNKVHVAIWKQKTRLRVYLGESKIWDLPRAFNPQTKINSIVFSKGETKPDENYFISNLRVAVGNPDTRNKLLTTGKFSTTGILFNTGSAQIKPESHGTIKQIASILEENPEVKVKVIGHTDNTGNDAANLKLSQERAESVKTYLKEVFKISASRIETDGKGASEPVAQNNDTEGKAQNRRVEFIKL